MYKKEIFLGVDPGFYVTGYAIIKQEERRVFLNECNYLKMSPKDTLVERVGIFYNLFEDKIKKHKVTNIAIETSFLGKNAQTFLKLGYLRGILYLLANQHNLKISEFAPREIKRAITGFGGASKDQIAVAMKTMFPMLDKVLKSARNDVSDALAITLCGIWQQGNAR